MRALSAATGFVALSAALYFLPTLLESWLAGRLHSPLVYVVAGDLIGCIALALWNRRMAILVYTVLSVAEFCLWRIVHVPIAVLRWGSDIVPALLFAGVCLFAVIREDTLRSEYRL